MLLGKQPKKYEQFFTKSEIAEMCINKLLNYIKLDDFETILEPACGEGAFVNALPNHKNIVYCDIDAKNKKNNKDFLKDKINIKQPCLTVGNPPFKLASQFFNKAAEFSDIIAFILPKSYNKISMINKLEQKFHCIYATDLPLNSFTFKNVDFDVPSIFQIWSHHELINENIRPLYIKILKTDDFIFINFNKINNNKIDFVIRRNGVYAGKIFTDNLNKWTSQNHYFIQVNENKNKIDVLNKLKSLDLENCIYKCGKYPSISKTELCYMYNSKNN